MCMRVCVCVWGVLWFVCEEAYASKKLTQMLLGNKLKGQSVSIFLLQPTLIRPQISPQHATPSSGDMICSVELPCALLNIIKHS